MGSIGALTPVRGATRHRQYGRPVSVATGLVALFIFSGSCLGAGATHSIQLDDILRIEGLGLVDFAAGDIPVFEYIPPYNQRATFGVEDRVDAQIKRVTADGTRNLFPQASDTGYWLAGFSPNRRKLAVWNYRRGALRLGVYDFARDRFENRVDSPYLTWAQSRPLWLDDNHLVVDLMPDRRPSALPGIAISTGQTLDSAWRQAWYGGPSTGVVLESDPGASTTSDKAGSLVEIDVDSGAERKLADGQYLGLSANSDASSLAAVRRSSSMLLGPMPSFDAPPQQFVGRLTIISLRTEHAVQAPCDACDVLPESLIWSDDGQLLYFLAKKPAQIWSTARFWVYDRRDDTTHPLDSEGIELAMGSETQPMVGLHFPAPGYPDSQGLLIAGHRSTGTGVDWYLLTQHSHPRRLTDRLGAGAKIPVARDKRGLILQAQGHLWRISAASEPVDLTGGFRTVEAWHRDASEFDRYEQGSERAELPGRSVLFRTEAHNRARFYVLDLMSDRHRRVAGPADGRLWADISGHAGSRVTAASSGDEQIVFREDGPRGGRLLAYTPGRHRREWIRINAHLESIQPVFQRQISYGVQGRTLSACVHYPANERHRAVATIVVPYPEHDGTCRSGVALGRVLPLDPAYFISHGYAVIFPQAPRDLLQEGDNPNAGWAKTVVPAIRAAANAGITDLDRVAVLGWSQGGFSALWLLSQSDLFKSGVIGFSSTDNISAYGEMSLPRHVLSDELFAPGSVTRYEWHANSSWLGGTPWTMPDRYLQSAPLFKVEKMQAPLLIFHSDLDWNWPMGQSDELFTALYRLGRRAEYVTYLGESHGVSSPSNIQDSYTRALAWFDRYLKQ